MQSPPEAHSGSSNRSFGLIFSVFLAVVALLPLASGGAIRVWACLASGFFLLSALAWPHLLAPMNRAWTALGNLLHRIVSPVALALIFFGAVLPTGLWLRLWGRDPLRLRLEPGTHSYWIRRDPPGPEPESLKNQF